MVTAYFTKGISDLLLVESTEKGGLYLMRRLVDAEPSFCG
jgi:hypothetical protein